MANHYDGHTYTDIGTLLLNTYEKTFSEYEEEHPQDRNVAECAVCGDAPPRCRKTGFGVSSWRTIPRLVGPDQTRGLAPVRGVRDLDPRQVPDRVVVIKVSVVRVRVRRVRHRRHGRASRRTPTSAGRR